jgi:hypothetical protein
MVMLRECQGNGLACSRARVSPEIHFIAWQHWWVLQGLRAFALGEAEQAEMSQDPKSCMTSARPDSCLAPMDRGALRLAKKLGGAELGTVHP